MFLVRRLQVSEASDLFRKEQSWGRSESKYFESYIAEKDGILSSLAKRAKCFVEHTENNIGICLTNNGSGSGHERRRRLR
ncbi:hypothetical protein F2Q70_00020528 [Brassica cretica]|uniref:Uncharacterized protein n=1 Tax=Brassica cretica TaxID=69181 RepID=A0A8S9HM23_BRACR|nr:hypothetical protein F2Q70_00020528 [Brassica cretica]KAF2558963.1 hypothetical protein F2Q68_00014050 [Brassica cretica]